MFFTEEFNAFVIEPYFEWLYDIHPLLPAFLLVSVVFTPVVYLVVKNTYFNSSSYDS